MSYCLNCGKPMKGHRVSDDIYTFECLNPACSAKNAIIKREDAIDPITWLIKAVRLIADKLGVKL